MKLRVLHIIPTFGIGGAERMVVNLLKAFNHEKFEVAACSLYSEASTFFEKQLKECKIPVYYLGKHKGLDLRMIPRLYHLFRTFKPDIVHTHLYAMRNAIVPIIICHIPLRFHTLHTIACKETDRIGRVINWIAFYFCKVIPISISQEVAKTAYNLYHVKTPIIYNGISINCFQSQKNIRSFYRKKENLKESDIIFVHVANFSPQKNHQLLIKAFEQAVKQCPNLKLLLVGDGELRIKMEKFVNEEKLEQNVYFLGLRQNISELLTTCDIFILSSDWEGTPMTILEAMSAGKPIIVTAVGGVPELVKDNVTGLLVPPKNAQALVKAMLRLANNPILREKMGRQGQRNALERFDINQIARQYEELYLKSLEVKL